MTTFSKQLLSGGGSNNQQIGITATTSGGANTIHTAHATSKDEITLFACNLTNSPVVLTILFGGTGTSDQIIISLPAQQGHVRVVAGAILTGGVVVKAFADTPSAVNVTGYVNRIT